MPMIRIEARKDTRSSLYFVEIYYPAGAEQPFVTTEPRYMSEAAAENDTIAILAASTNTSGRPGTSREVPPEAARGTGGFSDREHCSAETREPRQ